MFFMRWGGGVRGLQKRAPVYQFQSNQKKGVNTSEGTQCFLFLSRKLGGISLPKDNKILAHKTLGQRSMTSTTVQFSNEPPKFLWPMSSTISVCLFSSLPRTCKRYLPIQLYTHYPRTGSGLCAPIFLFSLRFERIRMNLYQEDSRTQHTSGTHPGLK